MNMTFALTVHMYHENIIVQYYTQKLNIFFTADYISIMEPLVFDGSSTSDRQCVNITIVDDDRRESSLFTPQPEVFQVLLNVSEPNDAVQLGVQTASISIEDDDCKLDYSFCFKNIS